MCAVLRIIRHLRGPLDSGLLFPSDSNLQLRAFADADWAICPSTLQFTTGWCVFLVDSLISWKCKKQPTVSKSSTEAENRAMSSVSGEIIWLHGLFNDFGISCSSTAFYADNLSAFVLLSILFIMRIRSIGRLSFYSRPFSEWSYLSSSCSI